MTGKTDSNSFNSLYEFNLLLPAQSFDRDDFTRQFIRNYRQCKVREEILTFRNKIRFQIVVYI